MSFSDSIGSHCSKRALWGCELSGAGSSHTFPVPDDGGCEHRLLLHTICLGQGTPNQFHAVEAVDAGNCPVTLATLKPSVLPMATLSGLPLSPPVTFRLRAGSGPVHIFAELVSLLDLSDEEEEEEDEEEEEESPEKPPKGSSAPRGGAAKGRRAGRGGAAAPER